jgi:hypothetical protein
VFHGHDTCHPRGGRLQVSGSTHNRLTSAVYPCCIQWAANNQMTAAEALHAQQQVALMHNHTCRLHAASATHARHMLHMPSGSDTKVGLLNK